jgi:TolB-like protein
VLPFANRSANADDAYFTDGIHDDLLTHLSRISDIKSIARSSVMGYRDTTKQLQQIGEELGVATVLQGGVQRAGITGSDQRETQ